MRKIIYLEIKELFKNKVILITSCLMIIYALIENFYMIDTLYIGECDYISKVAQETGIAVKDIVTSNFGTYLIEYAHALYPRASICLPIYIYLKYIFIIIVPLLCYVMSRDFSNGMTKQKVTYYGRYKYCVSKAVAFSLYIGVQFVIISCSVMVESCIYKMMSLENVYYDLYEAANNYIGNFYMQYVIVLLVLIIFVFIICVFICALAYFTAIPYMGVIASIFCFLNQKILLLVLPMGVINNIVNNIMRKTYMGNFSIGVIQKATDLEVIVSYYIWGIIFIGTAFLMMKRRDEYIL